MSQQSEFCSITSKWILFNNLNFGENGLDWLRYLEGNSQWRKLTVVENEPAKWILFNNLNLVVCNHVKLGGFSKGTVQGGGYWLWAWQISGGLQTCIAERWKVPNGESWLWCAMSQQSEFCSITSIWVKMGRTGCSIPKFPNSSNDFLFVKYFLL